MRYKNLAGFMNHWFAGFEKGLNGLCKPERERLLGECGRACSESYSLNVYKGIRENAVDVADFFEKLKSSIPEIAICEVEAGSIYEIHYRECLCDLYTMGYLKTGCLCECSRRSLLYNLSSVFPEMEFDVILKESILRGNHECILHIIVRGKKDSEIKILIGCTEEEKE